MGTLIFLLLLGVAGFGLIMFFFIGAASRADKKLASNSGDTTRQLFDGRRQVTYTRGIVGLQDDVLLQAADRHGYDLTGRDTGRYDTTLTFTKR